jgi:hypothetical protein
MTLEAGVSAGRAEVSERAFDLRISASVSSEDMGAFQKERPQLGGLSSAIDYFGTLTLEDSTLRSAMPGINSAEVLRASSENIFARIDSDRSGALSARELGSAGQNNQYLGLDAQAITALYTQSAALARLSSDDWGR